MPEYTRPFPWETKAKGPSPTERTHGGLGIAPQDVGTHLKPAPGASEWRPALMERAKRTGRGSRAQRKIDINVVVHRLLGAELMGSKGQYASLGCYVAPLAT